uniref:Ig-like domain-containing protein n=1 Tax=Sinocyclocheilus rhinocerous TaxID=307959 RepID=A0A673HIB6_9TELE
MCCCCCMHHLFNVYVLLCPPHSLVICVVCSPVIQQSPKHLLRTEEEKEAKLFCRHGDNDYPYLYWYQKKSNGGSFELIGMLSYGTDSEEDKFKSRFNITGHAKEDAFLLISNIAAEDSAVYFCAASEHSRTVPYNHWQKNCSLCTCLKKKKKHQMFCTVYSWQNWQ